MAELSNPTLRSYGIATARYFGVSLDKIQSRSRKKSVCHARHVFVYAAYMNGHTKWSMAEIGEFVGRGYTTVIHSIKVVRAAMEANEQTRIDVERVQFSARALAQAR